MNDRINNSNVYNWQNITWIFFHKLALNQDTSKNNYYEKFFNSFKTIIPCGICRNHYIHMLNESKFNLKKNINKQNLFNFTIDIHNNVNKNLGGSSWNYHKSRVHYNSFFFNIGNFEKFISIYVFHNFKKGPEKTQKLFQMLLCFAHIFPRYKIREKLIEYVDKLKPNIQNFNSWLSTYLFIIRNTNRFN